MTTVGFKGTRGTMTVRLTAGRWEYYCAPHERTMKGHFTRRYRARPSTDDRRPRATTAEQLGLQGQTPAGVCPFRVGS